MTPEMTTAVAACKQILAKLALLADANAGPPQDSRTWVEGAMHHNGLRTRGHHGLPIKGHVAGESAIPDGIDMRRGDHAPSKDLSLHAHYLWRMRKAILAEDHRKLLMLAGLACRDYAMRTEHIAPARHEYHKAAERELLTEWAGEAAHVVATWLDVPVKWVRQQRIVAGAEPEYGGEADADSLRQQAALLKHHDGLTTRQIGEVLGVSAMRVSRLLNGE